jgi:hypothetical protein
VDGGQGERRGRLERRHAVEAVLEDRVDVTIRTGADGAGAGTGLLQPRVAVAFGQPQDAQAGAVALILLPQDRMLLTREQWGVEGEGRKGGHR